MWHILKKPEASLVVGAVEVPRSTFFGVCWGEEIGDFESIRILWDPSKRNVIIYVFQDAESKKNITKSIQPIISEKETNPLY